MVGLLIASDCPLSKNQDRLLAAAAALSSLITTVIATFLIALKIILVTRRSRMQHSYTKVLDILIQSAALEAVVLLGITTLSLVGLVHPFIITTTSGRSFYSMYEYLVFMQCPVTVRSLPD